MMLDFKEFLIIDLIIALIVLVIIFIILGIKLIKTLSRVEKTLDVVDDKLSKTDGMFSVFDKTGSKLSKTDGMFSVFDKTGSFVDEISDKVIMLITNLISKFINKKKGNDLDE